LLHRGEKLSERWESDMTGGIVSLSTIAVLAGVLTPAPSWAAAPPMVTSTSKTVQAAPRQVGGLFKWLKSPPLAHYTFGSEWVINRSDVSTVQGILAEGRYSDWWSDFRSTQDLGGGKSLSVVRSRLPYSLHLGTQIDQSYIHADEGRVHALISGDLQGDSNFQIRQEGTQVRVSFVEHAATTKKLFNLLAPIAGGLMRWNHKKMMEDGQRGLQLAADEAASRK
jgi:hypothetical protein